MKKANIAIGVLLMLSGSAVYADDSDDALTYKLLLKQQQLHSQQMQDMQMQHAHQLANKDFVANAIEQIQQHKIDKLKEQMSDHFAPAQQYSGQPSSPKPTYYPPNNPGAAIYPKQQQDYNPQTERFETSAPEAKQEAPASDPVEQPSVKLIPQPSVEEQKPLDENGVQTQSIPADTSIKQPIMYYYGRPVQQYQRVTYVQPRRQVYVQQAPRYYMPYASR